FLTAQELDPIFHWKLRLQYGRTWRLLKSNSDDAYRAVTEAVRSRLFLRLPMSVFEVVFGRWLLTRGVAAPAARKTHDAAMNRARRMYLRIFDCG
ncbi:MAG: hypothetical protein ACREIC_11950, partial [Limisphaerales bacterium]